MAASKQTQSVKMGFATDRNLSLREKWRLNMERRKKEGPKFKVNVDPVSLNRYGPPMFLFVIFGGVGWGVVKATPVLYAEWGCEDWILASRLFALFMSLEVAVNWCLCRWVGSAYQPALHGTKPNNLPPVPGGPVTPDSKSLLVSAAEENGAVSGGVKLMQKDGIINSQDSACGKRSSVIIDAASSIGNGGVSNSGESEAVDLEYAPPDPHKKSGTYDGYSNRMMVATALPTAEGHVERKPFPYWSWVPCLMCQRLRPPRCHHCTLCKQCVLKRDHHCYLSGACIGVNNQRFFHVFVFWAFLLTWFGTCHMIPYTFNHVLPDYGCSYFDFLPPVSLVRGILGFVSPVIFFLCLIFWGLLAFTFLSTGTFFVFTFLLVKGTTSFESTLSIKVTDTRSVWGRLRSVFGDYWWLTFLVPTYPWLRPVEDAVLWPHIKPC